MDTKRFEHLAGISPDLLWLAVRDLTVNELAYAVHGGSPEVVSAIESVLSNGFKDLFHQSRARSRDFGDEATALARAKLIKHIEFYDSGFLGRPLGKLLCRFFRHEYPLNHRLWQVHYWARIRVASLLRQFWLLKERLEAI